MYARHTALSMVVEMPFLNPKALSLSLMWLGFYSFFFHFFSGVGNGSFSCYNIIRMILVPYWGLVLVVFAEMLTGNQRVVGWN
jgi:hypothetical protein